MTGPVRVGLVGCGRLAERGYLPAFSNAEGVDLVAVADRDEARCAVVAPACPAHASAAELLAATQIDLLVLAHAVEAHVADARVAAAVGVPSLVEKPPARTTAEAEGLAALDPPPWLGFNRRFEPAIGAFRSRLDTPPARLELEFTMLPSSWGARDGSEGALLDLGPHLVDLALWITGRAPQRVRVAHVSAAQATFEIDLDGVSARVHVSHGRAWRERLVCRDSRGRVIARLDRGGLPRRFAAKLRRTTPGPLVVSLAAQLTAAATAVRGGPVDDRLASVAQGIAAMRVLDAVAAADGNNWAAL